MFITEKKRSFVKETEAEEEKQLLNLNATEFLIFLSVWVSCRSFQVVQFQTFLMVQYLKTTFKLLNFSC